MVWWKQDDCGYTCDIREAKVFTEEKAKKICRGRGRYARTSRDTKKRMWPKKYIDERVSHHVDMQNCDWKQALKE